MSMTMNKANSMDAFIRSFLSETYDVPAPLAVVTQTAAVQIVTAWYIIQTRTPAIHTSLQSCRAMICPDCAWGDIGQALCRLLVRGCPPADFLYLDLIGSGNATVIVGHHATRLLAVKQHLFARGSWEIPPHVLGEMRFMERLQGHTWSPQMIFQTISQDMVQMGMEYLPLSMKQMVRFGRRDVVYIGRLFTQLVRAVSELHACGVVHRDLKPDNIRFRSNGDLVLFDYDSCLDLSSTVVPTRRVCTATYRDPALATVPLDQYDYRALDAFSCGAIGLYMFHGARSVFSGSNEDAIRKRMLEVDVGRFCKRHHIPDLETTILVGLLHLDPSKRLSLSRATRRLEKGCLS